MKHGAKKSIRSQERRSPRATAPEKLERPHKAIPSRSMRRTETLGRVLGLRLDGASYEEIAAKLGISPERAHRFDQQAVNRLEKAGLKSSDRGRVVPDLSLWFQAGRLGGKLTPADVSKLIRQADQGYPQLFMDLANECRQKDAHLSAVLTVAEESIAGLKWQLVLPDGARAKDKRAAKWAEKVLRSTPALRKLIAYLAGARYYGYDVNEIVWKKVDGKLVPAEFAHLAHRRFGFDPATGNFVLRDPWMPAEGIDFRKQWPNKFIVSQPRANGDAPQREGLARVLVWMTQFRVWTIADWLRTAELTWKPWRIGKYKKDSVNTKVQKDLEHILEKLTTTGWAAMEDSMSIQIEWPEGTQSTKATHAELVNVLANEMSKCVLGQTETTQASGSSGYAQAKVHDSVRKDLQAGAASQIAADLTRDLLTPLIALNFPGVVVPEFQFITSDPIDMKAFAEAIASLVAAQLEIPSQWVRDQAGIPAPKAGEETIGGKPPEPVATPPGAGKPANGEPDGDEEEEPEGDEAPAPEEPDADEEPAPKD